MEVESFLTGGSTRVLDLAVRLAGTENAEVTSPRHLLAALLMEEGVASEYLNAHGVDVGYLQSSGGDHWKSSWESVPSQWISLPHDEKLREIVVRARSRAHSGGRPYETDTLDLLSGLLEVGGSSAEILFRGGINAGSLSESDHSHRTGSCLSLPMDDPLHLESPSGEERISTLRIVDSSCNRLREGIRVIEEYFRFHRNDVRRTGWLKRWRHQFTEACRLLPISDLLSSRDTEQDVGSSITLSSEMSRESLQDVLLANLKRSEESCRTLEEYGKLVSRDFAERIKQLRYELYTFEKHLGNEIRRGMVWPSHALYLLVTEELCLRGSGPVIRGALAAGVRVVQIREKKLSDRKLLEHGRRVREWTREYDATLIMNDRPDLAVLIDADGVHVGQDEIPVAEARKIVGPRRFVGVSTHSLEEAHIAFAEGADYIGVGPVFPSRTKSFSKFVGQDLVTRVCEEVLLPMYAIGGIDAENLNSVLAAGARGIAVSNAICGAQDPQAVSEDLLNKVSTHVKA